MTGRCAEGCLQAGDFTLSGITIAGGRAEGPVRIGLGTPNDNGNSKCLGRRGICSVRVETV